MGVNVGGFLDLVASGLYFQTQLSHAVAQEVAGIRPKGLSTSAISAMLRPRT